MDPLAASRIKLRHLQCFLAVARLQSVQKAAQSLTVTQPAVSKTLRELETLLAVQLFVRSRRGTVMTPAAEVFLRHAQASAESLRAGLQSLAGGLLSASATIELGALPTVAPSLLPAVLQALRSEVPALDVRVTTGANRPLLGALKAGELDLVLGRMADPEEMVGLTFEHLYAEPLLIVVRAGHPLLGRVPDLPSPTTPLAPLDPAALAAYGAVLPARGTAIRHGTDSLMRNRGITVPAHCVETLSMSLARSLVLDGDWLWYVPAATVEGDLRRGWLKALPIDTSGTGEPVGLLLRNNSTPSPLLRTLIGLARSEAADHRTRLLRGLAGPGGSAI